MLVLGSLGVPLPEELAISAADVHRVERQPALFANTAREQCGLNRSPWDCWPRTAQTSLGYFDSAAIPRDVGGVPGVPTRMPHPAAGGISQWSSQPGLFTVLS